MALARCSGTIIRHIIKDAGLQSTDRMLNPLIYAPQGVRYKKKILQVILTTDIEKLGKAGEIVKVAPGYFRNYLMPKFLAVPNIDKFAYLVHEQRKLFLTDQEKEKPDEEVDRSEEERLKEYQRAAIRLENAILGVRRYTNHDGELRRPMTKRMITSEVAKQLRVSIEPENLHLPGPLTRIGEYRVPLLLPMSIPLPPGKTGWSLKLRIRHKPCLWVRHLPPGLRDRACAVRLPHRLQPGPTKVA